MREPADYGSIDRSDTVLTDFLHEKGVAQILHRPHVDGAMPKRGSGYRRRDDESQFERLIIWITVGIGYGKSVAGHEDYSAVGNKES